MISRHNSNEMDGHKVNALDSNAENIFSKQEMKAEGIYMLLKKILMRKQRGKTAASEMIAMAKDMSIERLSVIV